MQNRTRIHITTVAVLLAAATALAGRPQAWTHQTQRDFADGGTFDNTVINSYGELTLGRELKPVAMGDPLDMVVGVAVTPEAVYVAASPGGVILRIKEGKAAAFLTLPDKDGEITTLAASAAGDLLVAVSDGKAARLLKVSHDARVKPKMLFEKAGVENIWAIRPEAGGGLYLGTGPKGQLIHLSADGKSTVLLEGAGKNILAVAIDKQSRPIVGTDGNGLVIRVGDGTDPKKAFVLHESGENIDVTALAVDDDGNIYAGTASGEGSEGGDLSDMDDDLGSKSKPGKIEPDAADMPDEDVPTGGPKKTGGLKTKPPKDLLPKEPAGRDPKEPREPKGKLPATRPALRDDKLPAAPGMLDAGPGAAGDFGPTVFIAESNPFIEALRQHMSAGAAKGKPPASQKKPKPGSRPPQLGGPIKPLKPMGPALGGVFDAEPANAVVRIAVDGSVSTAIAADDMVMSLLWHKGAKGGELLVGTGPDGKIYSYSPEDESQALIARVKEENVTSLAADKDGGVFVGVSDLAAVYTLAPTLAAKGTYLSKVLDASRPATYGVAQLTATLPAGAKATIATRTGNVADVEKSEKFWSAWSAEIPADDAGAKLASPAARHLQYRVTLTGDGKQSSPTVDAVKISYDVRNLPPRISDLTVEVATTEADSDRAADSTPPERTAAIAWEAADPNHDTLSYRLFYRPLAEKTETWTPIVKDLKDTSYDWSTQTLPDGKYQVKVVASDAPDNAAEDAKAAARVSAPILIDHTVPELADLKADLVEAGGGKVAVTGLARDATSAIADIRFQVDGGQDWQPAKASDKIFDSLSEAFTLTTRALAPGAHRITVRATDAAGNAAYKAVTVTVK